MRPFWPATLLGGLTALVAGCAATPLQLERALLSDRNPAAHTLRPEAHYQVRCPDVLQLDLRDYPRWSGTRPVGPDGRIELDEDHSLRVDGLPPPEIARALARKAGLSLDHVSVRVAQFKSQQVFLHGEVAGLQRAVAYQGPETVVDLLQRTGGLSPGAAPSEVRVVRAHVADGKPPEVFTVDLEAILLQRDQDTNVRLAPFDQVHIGENRRSRLGCCFPPWFRPLYDRLCGMKPPSGKQGPKTEDPGTR